MAAGPYSAKVLDHFTHPRNVGSIEGADGVGEVGNPATGNMTRLHLRVRAGVIADARFRTFGCGVAIACSSAVTELVKDATVERARAVTSRDVCEALDGLPPEKLHCAATAERALKAALDDYDRRLAPLAPAHARAR